MMIVTMALATSAKRPQVKSSHLYLYCTALFTTQIVSKQLQSNNMKIVQQSLFLEENCVIVHLK